MEKGSHIYTRISSTIGTLALIVPTLWSFYHLFCDPLFHWWWSGPDPSVCRYHDVPCQGWFSIHTIARGVRQGCSWLHWLWGKVPPVLAPLSPVVLGVASAGCCSQPVAPPNWHPEKETRWRLCLKRKSSVKLLYILYRDDGFQYLCSVWTSEKLNWVVSQPALS